MKFRNLALSPRQVVDDTALCLVFFTRLPLPVFDFRGRSLAAAIWAAPIAGLVVGLIGAIVFATAERFGLGMGPAAALALVATVLTTGCLHEDGLSDVADGFGGGKSRGRKLEIMRDSRIGAYGAMALGLSLLIRWSALSEFVDPTQALFALLAAHAASRGLLGAFMHLLPSARVDGLSADAGT
ncbi:adenosylcobinamide-GDP ribazoletransferase, partial [Mesorhizobium sp. M7A.T.Ca.TU.009.01.3.1]